MMTILFWNAKRATEAHIAALVKDHLVDMLILVECKLDRSTVSREIQHSTGRRFWADQLMVNRDMHLFTSFDDSKAIKHLHDSERLSVVNVLTQAASLNLAILHFNSKMFLGSDDQVQLCPPYVQNIRAAEANVGQERTLIIGDFNMNPYEPGMLGCTCFHAVPSRREAARRNRTVGGNSYRLFYNPTWNFFGDHHGPPGTYYYDKGKPIAPFWHVFDQVLISPELLDSFDTASLQVLSMAGSQGLVDPQGLPCISDHLPIVFHLDEDPLQ